MCIGFELTCVDAYGYGRDSGNKNRETACDGILPK